MRFGSLGTGFFFVGGLGLLGCAPPNAAVPYPAGEPADGKGAEVEPPPPADLVRFLGREIRLEPFLAGFPYAGLEPDLEARKLFFLEKGDAYTLRMLDLPAADGGASPPPLDLAAGAVISDADWSKRSLWGMHWEAKGKRLWLHADAKNDEQMNLWTLDPSTRALEQVTTADYVYAFGFSEDESQLAYLPRTGAKAPFSTCLHVRDVASGEERKVVCDTPALTFTWSSMVFSPDERFVYFNAQTEGDRNRVQLVRVDLEAEAPKIETVTDPKVPRNSPSALETWVDGELLFLANDDGYRNLYAHDPTKKGGKSVRQITRFREDVGSAAVTDHGVFAFHGTPKGTTVELIDPATGKASVRRGLPGTAGVADAHEEIVLWRQEAPDLVYELNRTRLTADDDGAIEFQNGRAVSLPQALSDQIVRCEAETVEIPTFDEDPKTGAVRKLHAFVLHAKDQPEKGRRLVAIRSFYGGDNEYNVYDNILCAAGITVVSTAVRGSSGFGKAFYGLNDKDLGGDEIVDLFYVARFMEERGFAPERIGVYGRSHGGYATMRALTFPPQTNGRNERYDFGFGLAEAGFSDIAEFHDFTNIPDWVVLEAGDPKIPEQRKRLDDRSPINHVARLSAPLFLLHGENDWRVPVAGSRAFAKKAKALGKQVRYVEFEGQGHAVKGVERNVEAWQARFDFLASLPVLQDSTVSAPDDEASSESSAEGPAAP